MMEGSLFFPKCQIPFLFILIKKNAVQRIIHAKNTLLAYDVGAGKTYIMIAAAMKLRQEEYPGKTSLFVPK